MRLLEIIVVLLFLLYKSSIQSQCIVSEWGTWSKCHGGCQRGLIVRNRDVLQPPLPELTPEGKMMQRLCPHLYETRFCDASMCEEVQPTQRPVQNEDNYRSQRFENRPQSASVNRNEHVGQSGNDASSAKSLVEKQMKKVGFGKENEQTQAELKRKFISETEQLFKLDDAINKRYGPQPSDELLSDNNNITSIIDISTQQMSNKQWRNNMFANKWTSPIPSYSEHQQAFGVAVSTVAPKSMEDENGFRHTINNRKHRTNSDHSVTALLRRIEQALDTNQPLDEKYIRSAMRRNRKLSKILVDAYRQRQNLMNSSPSSRPTTSHPMSVKPAIFVSPYEPSTYRLAFTTASPPTTGSSTTDPSSFATEYVSTTNLKPATKKSSSTLTTTTVSPTTAEASTELFTSTLPQELVNMASATTKEMLFWPKTGGYVPNTRKHASEITSQLYMTNEIIQTLADDPLPFVEKDPDCEVNKRCCKIIKNTCSDGIDPKFVKRWYRPKGSSVCVPYHYPRCSSMEEMEELPILFEQNCQDLCFTQQEKRISPLFILEAEDE